MTLVALKKLFLVEGSLAQRNAAKLYYFAEKDRLVRFAGLSFWGLIFWGLSAIISVICMRLWFLLN